MAFGLGYFKTKGTDIVTKAQKNIYLRNLQQEAEIRRIKFLYNQELERKKTI